MIFAGLRDEAYCKPFRSIKEEFHKEQLIELFKLGLNLVCADDKPSGDYCASKTLSGLLDDYLHHRSYSKYMSCGVADRDWQCCGKYVQRILSRATDFNGVLDYFELHYKVKGGAPIL